MRIFSLAFWKATGERCVRGAIAALVGAYVAGNLVFDTTSIGVTLDNVLAIAVGGAVSALALALGVQTVKKDGPALTSAEVLNPVPKPARNQRGYANLRLALLVVAIGAALSLTIVGAAQARDTTWGCPSCLTHR